MGNAPRSQRGPYARTRDLVGRRIVAVEWNRFPRGRGRTGRTADPVLLLDNGARISFSVSETEDAGYGIDILVAPTAPEVLAAALSGATATTPTTTKSDAEDTEGRR